LKIAALPPDTPRALLALGRTRRAHLSHGNAAGIMIESTATLHISEAEPARDVHAVLEKVRQGSEVVCRAGSSGRGDHEARGRAWTFAFGEDMEEIVRNRQFCGPTS